MRHRPPSIPFGLRSANGERGLSRRVEQVVGYPPLTEMDDHQRREFHAALLDADSFEDLPGKWQAAILEAEQSRPKLRVVTNGQLVDGASASASPHCDSAVAQLRPSRRAAPNRPFRQ
jgi:hypothetical protein